MGVTKPLVLGLYLVAGIPSFMRRVMVLDSRAKGSSPPRRARWLSFVMGLGCINMGRRPSLSGTLCRVWFASRVHMIDIHESDRNRVRFAAVRMVMVQWGAVWETKSSACALRCSASAPYVKHVVKGVRYLQNNRHMGIRRQTL